MPDDFREDHYYNIFDQVSDQVWTICFGLTLTLASVALLIWNEASAVSNEHFSNSKEAREVIQAPRILDPANEGKLVYICGTATADSPLSDMNGLVKVHALRLKRDNRFYQWTESKDTYVRTGWFGEMQETTYSYDLRYEGQKIDSTKFKHPAGHSNAKVSESFTRDQIATMHIGNYQLNKGFAGEFEMQTFKFSALKLAKPSARKWNGKPFVITDDDSLIVCDNYNKPQIGDAFIDVTYAPEAVYSIVGQQHGKEILPIKLDNGSVLNSVRLGTVPSRAILKENQWHETKIVWGARLAGILLMWVGLYFLFVPLQGFLQNFPGFQFLAACEALQFAISFGFSLSVIIIASSWIVRHPQTSYVLYAVGGASALAMYVIKTNQAAQDRRVGKSASPLGSN